MAKCQKKNLTETFCISECVLPQDPSNQALNSLDSSWPNRGISKSPETGGFRKLFLPENDFQTCSTVNFKNKNI